MLTSEITDKIKWNKYFGSKKRSQFLQSYEWGEFQKSVGRKVWRLGIENDGKLVDAVQIIKHDLPLGKSYLYVPRIVMSHEGLVIRELKKIAQQENSIFIKFEPVNESPMTYDSSPMTRPVQPQTTLYLNLTKSEEEILKNMHPKTRYNIRLAERHGVKIKESDNINEFLKLNQETAKRDNFRSYPDDYYRKMFEMLGNYQLSPPTGDHQRGEIINYQCRLKLFTAYYQDNPLSSNIIIFFGDTASYIHGASANEHRNLMAPHLLQWEVIKYAKSQGYKWYDFWGVNSSHKAMSHKAIKPEWEGITRFKRGFVSKTTGLEVTFPGCFDLPINKFWYKIYRIIKRLGFIWLLFLVSWLFSEF